MASAISILALIIAILALLLILTFIIAWALTPTIIGPQGVPGEPGPTGPTGPNQGPTGPAGAPSTIPGPTGVQGPTGAASTVVGPTGPCCTGPTGPCCTGPTGATGDRGSTGSSCTGHHHHHCCDDQIVQHGRHHYQTENQMENKSPHKTSLVVNKIQTLQHGEYQDEYIELRDHNGVNFIFNGYNHNSRTNTVTIKISDNNCEIGNNFIITNKTHNISLKLLFQGLGTHGIKGQHIIDDDGGYILQSTSINNAIIVVTTNKNINIIFSTIKH